MASEISICNLALAHLGDTATIASIDPPEGSAQAEHCATFYPMARDALLEMHDWKFATKRISGAQLAVDTFNWAYAYALPNDCIRVVSVLLPGDSSVAEGQDFEVELAEDDSTAVFTDAANAVIRHTVRIIDTTKYPPLFVEALSRLLASYLAGPVIKGDQGKAVAKGEYQTFLLTLSLAKASDANQQKNQPEHTPDWVKARS